MNKNSSKIINQKGFTIVEALVTLLILSLGLVPVLGAFLSSLDISSSIRDNFIAANLAQEGVEIVRSIRDRNWLLDIDPAPPNPLTAGMIGTWRVEYISDTLISLGSNPFLKIDPSGVYNYANGIDTKFKRVVIIEDGNPADPDKDMRVISEVIWESEGNPNRVMRVESHLFNWR